MTLFVDGYNYTWVFVQKNQKSLQTNTCSTLTITTVEQEAQSQQYVQS